MEGFAPVLKVLYSPHQVFAGKCIFAMSQKQSHVRLITSIGSLTLDAIEIISWLSVIVSKTPLIVPNHMHNGVLCTLYIFDLKYVNSKAIETYLMGALELQTKEQVNEFIASL